MSQAETCPRNIVVAIQKQGKAGQLLFMMPILESDSNSMPQITLKSTPKSGPWPPDYLDIQQWDI